MNPFGGLLGTSATHNEIIRRQQQVAYESHLASAYGSWDATAAYAGTSATAGTTSSDIGSILHPGANPYFDAHQPIITKPEPAAQTFLERLRFEIDTWIKLERK